MTVSHIDEPTATIFDIQHYSLNDGPGIRTNIFFKGCPLRCVWCHNPESYTMKKQLSYNGMLCTRCFKCVDVCPTGAMSKAQYMGQELLKVDFDKCIACGKCVDVCCYGAVEMIGKKYTVDEVLQQIETGRPYFKIMEDKGQQGGITLTGGEPMMQLDFIEALLEKTEDIHVCMETGGYAPAEDYKRIAPKIDIFLYDYKATGSDKHKELCGVENELILSNLDMLYEMGADIILRMPMIPGVNGSKEHIRAAAEIIKKYPKLLRAEIMAYNNFGASKAEQVGMEDKIINLPNADKEQKDKWIREFEELGVKVYIG